MVLNISFKHMRANNSLKTFIEEKSNTLKKYFQGKITVTWNLTHEKQTRVAHCHLVGNQMDFFGEADSEDFRAAIDSVVEKIEKQLRKRKEKVKNHLHKSRPKASTSRSRK